MRVHGSAGSIFALGDAATIEQPHALQYAEQLFKEVGRRAVCGVCGVGSGHH